MRCMSCGLAAWSVWLRGMPSWLTLRLYRSLALSSPGCSEARGLSKPAAMWFDWTDTTSLAEGLLHSPTFSTWKPLCWRKLLDLGVLSPTLSVSTQLLADISQGAGWKLP